MSSAGMGKLAFYDRSHNHKFHYQTHAGLNLTGGLRIGHSGSVLPPELPFLLTSLLSVFLINCLFLTPQMWF